MAKRTYRPGRHLVVCDRTGFVIYDDDARKEWNGLLVRSESWEPRHPQDFVRGRVDRQTVPDPRPRPNDVFLDTNDVTVGDL